MENFNLKLSQALLWVGGYLFLLLLCALLDVAVWRKLLPRHAPLLNLGTTLLGALSFLILLNRAGQHPSLFAHVHWQGILLALVCAGLFYLLLDKGLDPLLDSFFPQSKQSYEESLSALKAHPVPALIQVCLIAPIMEETLTRGILLGGLQAEYGLPLALGLSAGVFALLHFNLVQTLSALVCGLVLGLLYIHTGSLICCILAHSVYNLISYLALLRA